MTVLVDAGDRHAALHDFGHNLVVNAGAGTGKTSLLVGRLLAALTLQHFEPHQVLALTFTENAAAEMHDRLQRLLRSFAPFLAGDRIEASDRHVLATLGLGPEFRPRIQDLLHRIEELRISTFHGFCLGLLQDHAQALDLPPDLRIADVDITRARFDEAFVEFIRAQDEVPPALHLHEPSLLRDLAWKLLSLPEDCWDQGDQDLRPADLPEHLNRLTELLGAHPKARRRWRELGEALLGAYDDLLADRGIRAIELPAKTRVPAAGATELGAGQNQAAMTALQEHLDRLLPHLQADGEGITAAMEFLRPFLSSHRETRLGRGEVSFDDLILLTRECLMRDPDFRERTGGSLGAILLDEFQDTDPLQYDVIFLLAAAPGQGRVDSPLQVSLRPAVLYIVGDAKQSIYRFRRADIAAYARAVDRVVSENGRKLHLVSNFRSNRPILEFVHRVCSRSLAGDPPFQFAYQEVIPTLGAGEGNAVEIHQHPGGDDAVARRVREGRVVIAIIEALREQGHQYGDMAVLLRAATETNWLLRPLREAGIPYVLEGSKFFYRRHEVILATALITAVARPWDPVALLAVLRSSLVGARDGEIARHVRDAGGLELGARGAGPVAEGLRWLQELHRDLRPLPVDIALTAILTHPRLTVTEGSGFEGAQSLANLQRLLTRLLAVAPLDLQAAADWLARNTGVETEDGESPLFELGMDALRILTVHKAKGLEFDVVILPDLARRLQTREDRVQARRLFAADGREMVALRLDQCRNTASAIARIEAPRYQLAEERRLFYVAATRARKRLVLLCDADPGPRTAWQEDLRGVSLDFPGAVLVKDWRGESARAPKPHKRVDAEPALAAVRAHGQLLADLAAVAPKELPPPSNRGDLAVQGSGGRDRQQALRVGEAMHRYLALVDLNRLAVDEALLDGGDDPEIQGELRELAEGFHRSSLRRRLAAATRVLREVPVAYLETTGELVGGTLDALVVEGERVTVLDYKTTRSGEQQAAVKAYRPQLHAYGRGVQKALGLKALPALEIHFLRDDHTHPLEIC